MSAIPERIGSFRIERVVGEGAFGTVFLGHDENGLDRDVAIKLLRPGRDTDRVRSRFAAERQALALMEHEYIARIFEDGAADDGAAFFAMEYVDGPSITEFADSAGLDLAAQLRLFEKVCVGVQHAHQKGVIHRDLKPSNILVAQRDGDEPTPKLIDFGLARAEDRLLVDDALPTFDGEVLGTLTYMSPEQARGRHAEVDTRTDVYSLGVVLYELLVGGPPFDLEELSQSGLERAINHCAERDPAPPSARASGVPVELDWITMRALEKDPDRRYPTAAAMADDIGRYLRNEPVVAGPTSTRYRLAKFVRRNSGAVFATTLVVLAMVIGATSALLSARRAEINLERAEINLERFELLAGAISLAELEQQEAALQPAWPENIEAFRTWLEDRAEPLAAELPRIRAMLADLRLRAEPRAHDAPYSYARDADEYLDRALTRLEKDLAAFVHPKHGLLRDVRRRYRFAETVQQRSIDTFADDWRTAIDAIAASEHYGGLRIKPQLGLVPIGADSTTGLWEFAHLRSHTVPFPPERDNDGRLSFRMVAGIVFVLVPGATVKVGAQPNDAAGERYDPHARPNEHPLRVVTLAPFFLAKTELTQAQWGRLGCDDNPSYLHPDAGLKTFTATAANPVEQVSWTMCVERLARDGLRLPTELEWEYSCRGGTDTPWCYGAAVADLEGCANLSDETARARYRNWSGVPWADGYVLHAPVASFRANGFGLHDMVGNVWEWCGDAFDAEVRAVRGGSFVNPPVAARSAYRGGFPLGRRNNDLGVRAARSLQL